MRSAPGGRAVPMSSRARDPESGRRAAARSRAGGGAYCRGSRRISPKGGVRGSCRPHGRDTRPPRRPGRGEPRSPERLRGFAPWAKPSTAFHASTTAPISRETPGPTAPAELKAAGQWFRSACPAMARRKPPSTESSSPISAVLATGASSSTSGRSIPSGALAVNGDRLEYWRKHGAQLSHTLDRLLKQQARAAKQS